MTPKDLFRLIIKLFGLYGLILSIFQGIPAIMQSYAFTDFNLWFIIYAIGIMGLAFGIYYILLQKVDGIINFLKLDKGFENEVIQFGNLNSEKIISIATIIIGGFLIVDYLPTFLFHCYSAFRDNVQTNNGLASLMNSMEETVNYFEWGISAMNLIIGYLFLTNYDRISKKLAIEPK